MAERRPDEGMLQPIQLEHVLSCYRDDIGTLRRLLARVGLPLDSAVSLAAVLANLESSRSFRRDLSLHLASMAHVHGQHVSPADLLGIVALAAAGPAFASTADQTTAHALLQFVMEVCEQQKVQATPQSPSRYRALTKLVVVSTASILLLAFAVLLWETKTDTTAPVASLASFPHVLSRIPMFTPSSVLPSFLRRSAPVASGRMTHEATHTGLTADHVSADSKGVAATPSASPTLLANALPNWRSEATPVLTTSVTPSVNLSATGATAPSMAGYPRNSAIPTAVLSQRLGARTIPADAYDDSRSYDTRVPQLLRRQPSTQVALADSSGLLDPEEAAPVFRTAAPSTAVKSGIVRPVSLGIMAGNIVYSPAPVYPAAASAAHVQGEVKVQAEIDRDGNVASVRAISGPPLLRDAAVYAVQRWRYRPYLSAGKPVSMSALAVMEFELP